ncbi:MAG TPA: DUF3055 domain-containing protein [Massilibacterium sp.]|nr:DUF3055 domain-containing protein [Massilibacterium sp.]
MEYFEKLYDEYESPKVRFVGFHTEDLRYDFGIIYTSKFFGKPLVVCMQSGRSTLLDMDDIKNVEHLKNTFLLKTEKEAKDLSEFLNEAIPTIPLTAQYE